MYKNYFFLQKIASAIYRTNNMKRNLKSDIKLMATQTFFSRRFFLFVTRETLVRSHFSYCCPLDFQSVIIVGVIVFIRRFFPFSLLVRTVM